MNRRMNKLVNNRREHITDTCNDVSESPIPYAKWKKIRLLKKAYIESFHLFEVLEATKFI